MQNDESPKATPRPTAASIGLGIFIVVQLAFIVLANVGSVALYFGNTGITPAAMVWKATGTLTEPWAHVTGQEQYWRMFAPSLPPRSMFLRSTLHIGDKTLSIPSEFEPRPGKAWFHPPGTGERLWHVEKSLAAPFTPYDPIEIGRQPAEWRTYLKNAIAGQRQRYLAYMAWKARRRLDEVGDSRRPEQIDLLVSIHTASRFDRLSVPEAEELILRWRPNDRTLHLCTSTPAGVDCQELDQP